MIALFVFVSAPLVFAACDTSRSVNVCLSADLNACKSSATTDVAKCACVTTAQACIITADCGKDAAVLGTLQLAYAAMAQTCEMPETTALPSVGGVCSVSGQTYCLNAVNWCARINRGSGFPQPAVCNGCIDALSTCLNKYACVDAYAQMAFKLSGMAFQCGDVSARFNGTVVVGSTTAATGATLPPTVAGNSTTTSTTTVVEGSTASSTTSASATPTGSSGTPAQGSTSDSGSTTTSNDSKDTTESIASRIGIVSAGIASMAAWHLAM